MGLLNDRVYTRLLQFSTITLSWALIWFSFVYYPKVIDQYRSGQIPMRQLLKPVSATSSKFPIETKTYRLVYEPRSQTYYAFIEGNMLDVYAYNHDNAKLALKSALSLENLCTVNVIYVAVDQDLDVPLTLKDNTDC